jgi:hypothetical protein
MGEPVFVLGTALLLEHKIIGQRWVPNTIPCILASILAFLNRFVKLILDNHHPPSLLFDEEKSQILKA